DRYDDKRALGDWTPNEEKLSMPLGELVREVHALGLRFGIWMEPEMISADSDLYRAHQDWARVIPGRDPVRSRDQLVLDLSRQEVTDYLSRSIREILSTGVDYLKWDINRSIADVWSHSAQDQGRVLYDYVRGLYRLMEEIHQSFPELLLESCSGGGGRFDAGMLYYSPQIWCSDNTDPVDRMRIQHGTSYGYPVSCMGSHVSVSPNEQTGRATPLAARVTAAMAGTFGYELDPARMTDEERAAIPEQIAAYHRDAELIRQGRYYRLTDPAQDPAAAWMFVSEDGARARLDAVQLEVHGNMETLYVRCRGLTAGAFYRIEETGAALPADALTDAGLPLPEGRSEYCSTTLHLERVR
ncbi:MAG: alpha-galactosidase, partial [Mogibacterium sp.]|nr:alpha-galactosidase [Mogibacterium sp.]